MGIEKCAIYTYVARCVENRIKHALIFQVVGKGFDIIRHRFSTLSHYCSLLSQLAQGYLAPIV